MQINLWNLPSSRRVRLWLDAHFALGTNMYLRGDFADSWEHLEQAFGDYQAGLRLTNIVASDTLAFALAYGASCNWHLGYPKRLTNSAPMFCDGLEK